MRICRICKGIIKDGRCPRCDKVRTDFEQVELKGIREILYALYVDDTRRFHERDAPTMLDYATFQKECFRNSDLMERLLTMYGLHHRIGEYLSEVRA